MYPLPVNFVNPADAFIYANTVTGGMFWTLILISLYVVVYLALSAVSSTMKTFSAMGIFGAVIATLLYASGLIPQSVWIISAVIMIAGFLMMLFSHGQYE